MPPPPASGDFNSHKELSAYRSSYTNHALDINVFVKHTSCAACTAATKICPPPQVFDLLTSKWGSRVTRVIGFLPADFQLAMPFHSRLMVRHGTDRQTDDGHQCIMPPPYEGRVSTSLDKKDSKGVAWFRARLPV